MNGTVHRLFKRNQLPGLLIASIWEKILFIQSRRSFSCLKKEICRRNIYI